MQLSGDARRVLGRLPLASTVWCGHARGGLSSDHLNVQICVSNSKIDVSGCSVATDGLSAKGSFDS